MRIAILLATAALAGCSQQSTTTTKTADGNTTTTTTTTTSTNLPTADSMGLQPGKWETKIAITSLEVNGASQPPPAGQTVTSCLTPEMAAKGPGEMLKNAGVDCTMASSSYSGGKISQQMTCKMPMGTMTSTTTGTYSATAMTSDADASIEGQMKLKEKIHTEARRIGECG